MSKTASFYLKSKVTNISKTKFEKIEKFQNFEKIEKFE